MANNKYYGYSPKTTKGSLGVPWGNDPRLENFNPYEFKKGMDWELATMGCPRLREATEDERTKATTTILKNLKESNAYYSYKMAYETKYLNHQGKKPTFKTYLKEIDSYKMQEVDKKYTNDKMENIKLKEALKQEIKSVLSEGKYLGLQTIKPLSEEKDDDEGPSDKEMTKSASKDAKDKEKKEDDLQNQIDKLKDEKKSLKGKINPLIADFKSKKIDKTKYLDKVGKIPGEIKDINDEISSLEKEIDDLKLKERADFREVAETAMDKDIKERLLELIREAGVSLREGADNLKPYYEVAKSAYMEGLVAGMSNE